MPGASCGTVSMRSTTPISSSAPNIDARLGKRDIRRMKVFQIAALAFFALTACATGPSAESPKGNPIARAKILSKNDLSITISHSKWGKSTAFQWADEHCRSAGKVAVYAGGTPEMADTISTWRCS